MKTEPDNSGDTSVVRLLALENKHRLGYMSQPVKKKEFSIWEKEQAWGDEWQPDEKTIKQPGTF